MNAQLVMPRTPWMRSTAASVIFHVAIALPFVLHFAQEQPIATPAAVMVEFSPEFEVSIIRPDLPPGVSQQRKVEAMTEEERRPEKEMPKLLVHKWQLTPIITFYLGKLKTKKQQKQLLI